MSADWMRQVLADNGLAGEGDVKKAAGEDTECEGTVNAGVARIGSQRTYTSRDWIRAMV
ncbi:MAG: hypothetical protein R3C99_09860 [Pirellulaceae bacterium]